jgi:plastocyanin
MSRVIVASLIMSLLVIGSVGMASAQESESITLQDESETNDCAVIISIAESGLAYDQSEVSIEVGDTVCWVWENEPMEHNVAETNGPNDNNRKLTGVYSGAAATTVNFNHTFTENMTFYYMCEPHVSMDMRGTITVGTGTPTTTPATIDDKPDDTVPGFGIVSVVLAGFAAVVFLRIETLRMITPRGSRIPREI